MDPYIPNAPFESDGGHLKVDPFNGHLYLDENIDHVDLSSSMIDDLNNISTALTIAKNLVSSLLHVTPFTFSHLDPKDFQA
jgi:hypothetical protein